MLQQQLKLGFMILVNEIIPLLQHLIHEISVTSCSSIYWLIAGIGAGLETMTIDSMAWVGPVNTRVSVDIL